MLIWIDDNTFQVNVRHAPSEGFIPTEKTIAMVKYAALIKSDMEKFLKEEHNPKVQKLLNMVAEWNMANNPEYAAKVKEAAAKRVIEVKTPTASKSAPKPLTKTKKKKT